MCPSARRWYHSVTPCSEMNSNVEYEPCRFARLVKKGFRWAGVMHRVKFCRGGTSFLPSAHYAFLRIPHYLSSTHLTFSLEAATVAPADPLETGSPIGKNLMSFGQNTASA